MDFSLYERLYFWAAGYKKQRITFRVFIVLINDDLLVFKLHSNLYRKQNVLQVLKQHKVENNHLSFFTEFTRA